MSAKVSDIPNIAYFNFIILTEINVQFAATIESQFPVVLQFSVYLDNSVQTAFMQYMHMMAYYQ